MEGAGSEDVIESFLDNFAPDTFSARYIGLDTFSFLYYLTKGLDEPSYHYAGQVIQSLTHYLNQARPDVAEAALLVGYKLPPEQVPGSANLAARALAVALGGPGGPGDSGGSDDLRAAYEVEIGYLRESIAGKNRLIAELEEWAHGMERELKVRDSAAREAARAAARTPTARARRRLARILGRLR
jgi:hypothetical protein